MGKTSKNAHLAEERGQADLTDAGDEEDKYSGVHRGGGSGKYVPPGKRSDSPTKEVKKQPQADASAPAPVQEAPKVERKKLSISAPPFKPAINISFSPAPAAAAAAPTPAPAAAAASGAPES